MTKIKLFSEKTPEMEKSEKRIDDFLKEKDGIIIVNDIKFTAEN